MACSSVLLTGAAGFIGSHTVRQLQSAGISVVGIDNLNDYYDPRIKRHRLESLEGRDGFVFHEMDVEDRAGLAKVFSDHQFDAVINLAARAGVRYSLVNPHIYLQTNTQGTLNLLELMKAHDCGKFVLASTSSLYAGQPMPFLEEMPVNEPISPYAASKKAAEMMAFVYHHLHGIDCSVVRYFTVYGPAGRPDMSVYRFVKWIDEGTPLTIYGDGQQSRDFTYVGDIAKGTECALQPVGGFEVVNLGGGRAPVTLLGLIQAIEKRLGKEAKLDFQPSHAADMKDTGANIEKAERLWGWRPEIDLEEGVDRTVAWYEQNRDWLADVPV